MNCRECKGRGWVRVPAECGKSASMCCGGCVTDETCFVCDGVGELKEATMDLDAIRLLQIYERLGSHTFKHEKLLKSIYEQINDIELYKALL